MGQTGGVPLPSSTVGRTTDPVVHEVDARWLMAYAGGVFDASPCLLDTTRPDGIVAHALFSVCLEWPAVLALRAGDDGLERDERRRGVHATHDLTLHRPIRPGDVLSTTATVVGVEQRAPGAYELVRLDTVDAAGSPVATTYMGNLFLGVDVDGPGRTDDAPPPIEPARPDLALRVDAPIAVPATAAQIYTACSRIWNPIHTDVAVARAAGLPGPILHGTATLALAITATLTDAPDPVAHDAVRRVVARFGAMVPLPAELHLRARSGGRPVYELEVADGDGRSVLRDARIELRGTSTQLA